MRLLLLCVLVLAGCNRPPLSARLADKEPAYLCKYLAQFIFEGESGKAMAYRETILTRGLDKDPGCKMVYESRMVALTARPARRVSWETAVGR